MDGFFKRRLLPSAARCEAGGSAFIGAKRKALTGEAGGSGAGLAGKDTELKKR
jgi:hypothetical protein